MSELTQSGRLIREAVLRYMDGEINIFDSEPGYCLRVTRELLMHGLGLSYEQFYKAFYTHPVEDEPEGSRWARSVMRSLREQGRRVAYRQPDPDIDGDPGIPVVFEGLEPGDVYCNWRVGGPIGHIGVLASGGRNALLLENTSTTRGVKISGYNRLGRVDAMPFPEAAEVFRL